MSQTVLRFQQTGARERLTADRTYYVRTDGSDSNDGLTDSSGGAFLTLQKAYDNIVANLDLSGYVTTIQVRNGTFGGVNINEGWTGGGRVDFVGDESTPSNVVISQSGGHCFNVSTTLPAALLIKGFKLTTTGASGHCIFHGGTGTIQPHNIDYGAAINYHIYAFSAGAQIAISSNYTISGDATVHIIANQNSLVTGFSRTVTISGSRTFTYFVWATRNATIIQTGMTYSAGATGTRYRADYNGVVFTNGGGATYFPGTVAGSTATGGQYG